MKKRCDDPTHPDYGGRGITYDPRWGEYSVFLADMGERPIGTTLDRMDVFKSYYKENCQWADAREQARNKRGVKFFTYDEFGESRTRGTAPEWAMTFTLWNPSDPWSPRRVRNALKHVSIDTLVKGIHPDGPSLAELEERKSRREDEERRQAEEYEYVEV